MWDWLRSPQDIEREQMERLLTARSREALMDAMRAMVPQESQPPTFGAALGAGIFDQPALDSLLERYRSRGESATSTPQWSGTFSRGT